MDYVDDASVVELIRQRLDQRNFAAWERLGTAPDRESPAALYNRIRMQLLEAERRRILEIRPTSLHQRTALYIGSRTMVERAERALRGDLGEG